MSSDNDIDDLDLTFCAEKHGDYRVVAYNGEEPYAYSEHGVFWNDIQGVRLYDAKESKLCHEYNLAGRPRHRDILLTISLIVIAFWGIYPWVIIIRLFMGGECVD